MSVFKAVDKSYPTWKDLRNLVNYVVGEKSGSRNVCGGQGILLEDGYDMYKQMVDVKHQFHKEDRRQALHYVLSFSEEEQKCIGIQEALQIGYLVAEFFTGWQVVFGIHTNTDNLHIHFVVNGTSYENGLAFAMGPDGLWEIKEYINAVVQYYCINSLPEGERQEVLNRKVEAMAKHENKTMSLQINPQYT